MMNIEAVEAATVELMGQGIRVLNAFLFAETEAGHVRRLMEFMSLPSGAVVLDAGCGVGEVALLMREERPDLTFKLLNISAAQLDSCPADMERIVGDFGAMPLADESVDVVMFHYAICHAADLDAVMREARRVLKEGGSLFINDMSREQGSNALMESVLQARAHVRADLEGAAQRSGLVLDAVYMHEPIVQRLRELLPAAMAGAILDEVTPTTWRFTRFTEADAVASAFARHERVGFQFSGGRDSTAALYLLRPYWPRMTIYHLDTGDQFPETRDVVYQVEIDLLASGCALQRIVTDVAAQREEFGFPSDLVPVDNTHVGRMVSGQKTRLQGRYECCARSLMAPMHARVTADGVTLIVRGQRDDEYAAPPMRSGEVAGAQEVLYPIQSWTGAQVSAYLTAQRLPLAPYYERGARRAPECMGCTAWWDEGRARYLRENHPAQHTVLIRRLSEIKEAIGQQSSWLTSEMES